MNNKYFKTITYHVSEIQSAIRKYTASVDAEIVLANRRLAKIEADYNAEAAARESDVVRHSAITGRGIALDEARMNVQSDFDAISVCLREWAVQPVDDAFANIINVLKETETQVTVQEIEALSPSAAGSYFSEKILHNFAEKAGMHYPFTDLAELLLMVETPRNHVITMLGAFPRADSPATWIVDGAYDLNQQGLSIEYLCGTKADTTFARMQEALQVATDTRVSLGDSEQAVIEKMFADCADNESKRNRMLDLLIARPYLDAQLATYDPETYAAAKEKIKVQNLNVKQAAEQSIAKALNLSEEIAKASRVNAEINNNTIPVLR